MKRFSLSALILLATVSAASAFTFDWTPSEFPPEGSFGAPFVVSRDVQGN